MSDPTIICVLGMHRSGTSLLARLLHALDLDLGPEEHMRGPTPSNLAGHWENKPITELNEEILSRFGGSWHEPPELHPGWERSRELDDLRHQARELVRAEFGDSDRWGFKDPRTCLTLPFWQRILPPMRYLICVRNPLDVAFSLKARKEDTLPLEHGFELWLTYVRAALAAAAPHPQQTVFYEDLMEDPEPVVRRVAGFIADGDSPADEASIRAAIRVAVVDSLRHHRTPAPNVIDASRVPFHVKAVYLSMRLFSPGEEAVGIEALDLLAGYAADAGLQVADLERRLSARLAEIEQTKQSRAEEREHRASLEAKIESQRGELEEMRGALEAANAGRDELEAEFEARGAELDARRAELEELRAEIEQLRRPPEPAPAETAGGNGLTREDAGGRSAKDRLLAEVRERAAEVIPPGSSVLVVSKGEEAFLELDGSRAMHFPAAADGRYLGFHPAGDTAAIAQLEAMRARGADHLLVPAPTLWWLDHYEGLRRHLEERYESLADDGKCAIFRLRSGERAKAGAPAATIEQAIASLRIRRGCDPSVLDWDTGLGIGERFPRVPVFAPPAEGDGLPYLDRTVDVVVLASGDSGRLAEARRVATGAVVRIDPVYPERAGLEWLAGDGGGWGGDIAIALLPSAGDEGWDPSRAAIAESLEDGFAGNLSVVDGSGSIAERARAVVEGSDHRIHVFVTEPAIALPGWLSSIAGLFSGEREAGVVGARVVSSQGALRAAGGVIAADGSPQLRGRGDENPDRPEYCFVRQVDFCSPPLLATTRELFDRLSGFDERPAAPADSLVDFSLRAGRSGAPVYYQPGAKLVAIGSVDR